MGEISERKFYVNKKSFDARYNPPKSEMNIFTDGSKMNYKIGAGFITFSIKKETEEGSFKMASHNSVFQAEILAI